MKKTGIYAIINKVDGRRYIGQSINIADRFIRHRYQLNKGNHYNKHLQRAWNKYGIVNFDFVILIECHCKELNKLEEWHVANAESVYNEAKDFTSRFGCKNPFFGKKHTPKTKEKMRQAKQGKFDGQNNPNYGGKNKSVVSPLMKGSNNCNAKLVEHEVREIKRRLLSGEKHKDIAADYNVGRTVITRISNGTRWSHIELEGENVKLRV